jgi:hypothetical protein
LPFAQYVFSIAVSENSFVSSIKTLIKKLLTMKLLTTAVIALFASTAFIACKKDHDSSVPPPSSNASVVGRWVGSYVNDASGNSFYYSFNIKENGVIEEVTSSGEKIGEGTWTYQNNILSAHYNWLPPHTSSYSIIASYYSNTGKLLGNWGYGDSNTDGGTWEMKKK